MEFRIVSALFGVVVLAAIGFFVLFPQFKPDWIQIHVGNGRGPARAGSVNTRNTSWAPDSKSADACFDRGVYHAEREEWDQAIKEFNDVLRLEPKNADAYHLRGIAHYAKDHLTEAISDFDNVLRLDPKNVEALLDRADARFDLGNTAGALADVEAALRIAPDNVSAYCSRGKFREEAGNYHLALEDYIEAVRLDPDDSLALNNLAWIMATAPDRELRDGRRAVTAAMRAVELDEEQDWISIDTLAAAFAEVGKFNEAIQSETEALRLAPRDEHPDLQARLELYKAKQPYRLPVKIK
jgi:tetratricopeptide (TPR) repeat protein